MDTLATLVNIDEEIDPIYGEGFADEATGVAKDRYRTCRTRRLHHVETDEAG